MKIFLILVGKVAVDLFYKKIFKKKIKKLQKMKFFIIQKGKLIANFYFLAALNAAINFLAFSVTPL